jgi:uncharacterized protein
VDISFDPAKNARNIATHGVSLSKAADFDWENSIEVEDLRRNYGERRFKAYGLIESRLHVLIHTPREGRMHVISLRKANKREVRTYEEQTKGETQGRPFSRGP